PRFLRMVREKGKISFEEAIKKITGAVAEKYGFIKRGVIEVGNNADLVILDPIEVGEKSTFENPAHYSTGITMVFVNGVLSYERGNFINSTSGEIIKPSSH
ncbi:MAG: amidohydrolase family protein, partial [Patescibacteria group bacterium]